MGIPVIELRVAESFTGVGLSSIRESVAEVLALEPSVLTLDLRDCPSVDAAGIAYLLDLHRRMRRDGNRLELQHPTPRVRRVLQHVRLDRILPVHGDQPELSAL
ncbi:STAS domain-containing protein [Cryptosporangium japonicum]|uniref:STAS domain-containing protein n=1 Tax=Cryptosporangium japonicum TaxID=80872 RepID=A0ABN0U9K3_9ACTN